MMTEATTEEWERRVLIANAEGMRWTCEQAGHPKQEPDDAACICETWAHHIKAGAVVVGCEGATRQMDCGHDETCLSVLGHCRACDLEPPTVDDMAGSFDGPDSVEWLREQRSS